MAPAEIIKVSISYHHRRSSSCSAKLTKFGFRNGQLLSLQLLLSTDLIGEELLERLGKLSFSNGGNVLNSGGGGGESVNGL